MIRFGCRSLVACVTFFCVSVVLLRLAISDEPFTLKMEFAPAPESSSTFNCTVVLDLIEGDWRTSTIRMRVGSKLVDSIRVDKKNFDVSLDRANLFGKGQQSANYKIRVISSSYMPSEVKAFIKSSQTEWAHQLVLESLDSYIARADGTRVPLASMEIRKFAAGMERPTHNDLIEKLEQQAQEAERLEKEKVKAALTLTKAEKAAVNNCLRIIRGCQLSDGAFIVMKNGGSDAPIWIQGYFANHAALALLAANELDASDEDLRRVERWLEWCAKHQSPEGFWFDQEGTSAKYSSTGKVDAWDSSAALYLLVAERYQRTGKSLSSNVLRATKNAVKCIKAVEDPTDGLTWAKPDFKVKYLMDNIETRAGLVAASKLYKRLNMNPESVATEKMAERIDKRLPDYWDDSKQWYAYALHPNGQFETDSEKLYPHGLAQLFGIAFVQQRAACWNRMVTGFVPDDSRLAAVGPERWLPAAIGQSPEDAQKWRNSVIQSAAGFKPQEVYIHRPGLAVLSVIDGDHWLGNRP